MFIRKRLIFFVIIAMLTLNFNSYADDKGNTSTVITGADVVIEPSGLELTFQRYPLFADTVKVLVGLLVIYIIHDAHERLSNNKNVKDKKDQ